MGGAGLTRRGSLSLVLVVALTGCSGGSPAPSPSPPPSAAPSPSPSPSALPSPSPTPSAVPTAAAPAAARPRLTGDGIDLPVGVIDFGTTFDRAEPALRRALGRPTRDTGVGPSSGAYGSCPGTRLRALEYGGGALVVLFGNVSGPALTMYQWALQPKGDAHRVPEASALVGDVTTYEFGIGTSLGDLRAGVATDMLKVRPGRGSRSPTFTLQDQSSGFAGQLSGTTDDDVTTYVLAGRPCGD